jgi:hypothetical protein
MQCQIPEVPNAVSELRKSAADALNRGFSIFACKPRSKTPLGSHASHGFESSSTDPEIALRAWDNGIEANPAIACGESGLAIVDCDHGLKTREEFDRWLEASGLPKTYTVRTGRRVNKDSEPEFGVQLYYDGAVKSGAFSLNGVTGEIKSIGGYVMSAGSIHPDSGEKYEVLCDAPIAPIPDLIRTLRSKSNLAKKANGDLGKVPANTRNTTLYSIAGTLFNKGFSEQSIYESLMAFARENCEHGENYAVENEIKIRSMAHRAMTDFEKHDELRFSKSFSKPAIPGGSYDYIVAPTVGQFDGWIPRRSVSIIGGSSGSMKSSIMFDLLRKQQVREPYLDHATYGLPFLVLMADRGEDENNRTLRRLKIDKETFPLKPIEASSVETVLQEIKEAVESCNITPACVFFEGADMILEDAAKMGLVAPFCRQLRKVAVHYHLAIVLSVGAPKTKSKDQYIARRDTLFGSGAWGRSTETVMTVTFPNGDDTSNRRELCVQLRNAPPEKFLLEIQEGNLVRINESDIPATPQDLNTWVFSQSGWFTAQDAARACSLHEKTVGKRFRKLHEGDILDVRDVPRKNQKEYRLLKFHAPQVSVVHDDGEVSGSEVIQ